MTFYCQSQFKSNDTEANHLIWSCFLLPLLQLLHTFSVSINNIILSIIIIGNTTQHNWQTLIKHIRTPIFIRIYPKFPFIHPPPQLLQTDWFYLHNAQLFFNTYLFMRFSINVCLNFKQFPFEFTWLCIYVCLLEYEWEETLKIGGKCSILL